MDAIKLQHILKGSKRKKVGSVAYFHHLLIGSIFFIPLRTTRYSPLPSGADHIDILFPI